MLGVCLWSYFSMCLCCRQHEEGASWPSLHPKPLSQMENKEAHASTHFTASHPALELWLMGLLTPLRTSLKAERQAHVRTLSPSTLSRCRIEAVLNEPLDKIASAPLRQSRGLFSLESYKRIWKIRSIPIVDVDNFFTLLEHGGHPYLSSFTGQIKSILIVSWSL